MTIQEHRAQEQSERYPQTLSAERPRPLRIVHLVSSLLVGGMEQFVLRIAVEQRCRGHRVAVIGLQGGPLLEEAQRLGIDAMALGGRSAVARVLRAALRLARLQPDIAHAHNPSALQYALLAKCFRPARVVLTRHGQGAKRVGSHLAWRHTDAVVAVSRAAAVALRRDNPEHADKVSVILNGVHLPAASGEGRAGEAKRGPGPGAQRVAGRRRDTGSWRRGEAETRAPEDLTARRLAPSPPRPLAPSPPSGAARRFAPSSRWATPSPAPWSPVSITSRATIPSCTPWRGCESKE